jgi:ketosteroid isomerase-like protein
MSQENVAAAKRAYAVLNDVLKSGDLAALNRLVEDRFDPEFVLKPAGVFPESEEVQGRDRAVEFLVAQSEAFDALWFEPLEFIDATDRVLVVVRVCGCARHTGLKLEFLRGHVFSYRGGQVLRMDMYADRAEALKAVGLAE